jgi:hypothetical protein
MAAGSSGELVVHLRVITKDSNVAARVAEQLARTAVGLAMEGVQSIVVAGPAEEEETFH